MNLKHTLAAAVVAATLTGAAAPAWAQLAEGVAAVVNDTVISTYDVRQRANMLIVSAGMQSTPELQQRARAQAIRDLVDERLQLQEAERFELTVTPDQVDRRIADIARSNQMTAEQFIGSLSQAGVPISTLRQQLEADIAWQRVMSGVYGSRLRISEVEIQETQARLAASATRPQYLISEIFLPASNDQEFQEMQQGGLRLIEEMQRGAPFPLVARQFSQSPSAAAGGDIGWIAATELAPELQPVADRLQPGQVSLPVRTPNGFYIIAVRDRRAGATAGSTTLVSLRQIVAPGSSQATLERTARRINSCGGLNNEISSVQGASVVDLGQTLEAELSPAIRDRINGVQTGSATPVLINGDQVNAIVVCSREAGGESIPSRDEIEARLREREMTMLSDRYLRNLRREATIITRQ